jgi:Utp21 specific WD40 associated putative domain
MPRQKGEITDGSLTRLGLSAADVDSEVVALLKNTDTRGDCEAAILILRNCGPFYDVHGTDSIFFSRLLELSPVALDLELRSLPPSQLAPFARALGQRLKSHQDFEAVQAILSAFLTIQGDALIMQGGPGAEQALRELRSEQQKEAERVSRLVGFCLGAVGFIRNVTGQ